MTFPMVEAMVSQTRRIDRRSRATGQPAEQGPPAATAALHCSGMSAPGSAPDLVSRADLESRLAEVSGAIGNPPAGLFGPESRVWEINRHAAMFLGGGRAALLQVAHPGVAQAIAHHSHTRTDPFGRFQRTFRQVFAMVWGDEEAALAAARRVHTIHTRIRGRFDEDVGCHRAGEPYQANERPALLWVHATLWETSIRMYETFVSPLTDAVKESYYQETRRFAALFGLEDRDVPSSWRSFLDYNRSMWGSQELGVARAGSEIARTLFRAPDPLLQPAFDRLRHLTSYLLPEKIRNAFDLELGDFGAGLVQFLAA